MVRRPGGQAALAPTCWPDLNSTLALWEEDLPCLYPSWDSVVAPADRLRPQEPLLWAYPPALVCPPPSGQPPGLCVTAAPQEGCPLALGTALTQARLVSAPLPLTFVTKMKPAGLLGLPASVRGDMVAAAGLRMGEGGPAAARVFTRRLSTKESRTQRWRRAAGV